MQRQRLLASCYRAAVRLALRQQGCEASSRRGSELRDHLLLAREEYTAATGALDFAWQNIRPLRPSARVLLALRVGLSGLRVGVLPARSGRGPRAATVLGSPYETDFTALYIGTDDDVASAWRDHGESEPAEPFRSVWKLTPRALRSPGVPDVQDVTAAATAFTAGSISPSTTTPCSPRRTSDRRPEKIEADSRVGFWASSGDWASQPSLGMAARIVFLARDGSRITEHRGGAPWLAYLTGP